LNPDLLHQETAHEPFVREGIWDNQDVGLQDCIGAERAVSRDLIQLKTDSRFKPYSLLINESDDGDRDVADKSSEMGNVVEYFLTECSENSQSAKTFDAGAFVLWERQLHLKARHQERQAVPPQAA